MSRSPRVRKVAKPFQRSAHRVDANRFGVFYLGDPLKVCFLEAVLRDRREGLVDDLPIDEMELTQRRYAEVATTAELRLVDLTMPSGWGCRPMSFGHSGRIWRAGGRWRFMSTRLSLTGSSIHPASTARPISRSTIGQ
ncbi:RES domain-containing protein [Mesorhizobium sp. BR1-1-6]|nr:RES domain-containing protein [Mesorhizobium sp. B1-1-3]MBZ9894514.1 RES domain-containing protein [Mesorhizobium sp. BR1-1-6]